jgi:hypothetical protein
LKGQKAVGKFGSRPRQIELRALKRKLDAYALHAMIDALYDALEFVSATRALLVVAARLVGPSMGDDEYAV